MCVSKTAPKSLTTVAGAINDSEASDQYVVTSSSCPPYQLSPSMSIFIVGPPISSMLHGPCVAISTADFREGFFHTPKTVTCRVLS